MMISEDFHHHVLHEIRKILREEGGLPQEMARAIASYVPGLEDVLPREERNSYTAVVFLGNRWIGVDERVLWPDDRGGYVTAIHAVIFTPEFDAPPDLYWHWDEMRHKGVCVSPNCFGVRWIRARRLKGFCVEHIATEHGAVAQYGAEHVARLFDQVNE